MNTYHSHHAPAPTYLLKPRAAWRRDSRNPPESRKFSGHEMRYEVKDPCRQSRCGERVLATGVPRYICGIKRKDAFMANIASFLSRRDALPGLGEPGAHRSIDNNHLVAAKSAPDSHPPSPPVPEKYVFDNKILYLSRERNGHGRLPPTRIYYWLTQSLAHRS